jgi:hypothetical protein
MAKFIRDDKASQYFECTDGERAAFEAGIKLGAIYHQFIGAPVCLGNVDALEKTIEEGTKVQPFVEGVVARIDRDYLSKKKRNAYDYLTISEKMLNVNLRVKYGTAEADCELKYQEELNYPLMYIKKMRKI